MKDLKKSLVVLQTFEDWCIKFDIDYNRLPLICDFKDL